MNNYENIPKELKDLKQWGCFHKKWVPERNKYTKIPINPFTGGAGKSNDQSTWSDFDTALRAIEKIDRADGLAFYFANGYTGLDIDHINEELEAYKHGDHENDNLVEAIRKLTKNTYLEVSLSGEGLHAIFKGKIPGKRRRKGQFEMYEKGRFFALTGNTFSKDPEIQSLNTDKMKKLYEYCFGKDKVTVLHPENVSFQEIDLSIPEIIHRAEQSKTGKRFELLLRGGWENFYNSHSEADMAFANDLAFWTGRNFQKMDTIFRNSSLMREKYDEKRGQTTYGASLLNKAINETTEIYSIRSSNAKYDLSFLESEPKTPKHYALNDIGNAYRFYDAFGKKFKYSFTDKKWFFYNGSYWEKDTKGLVNKAAEEIPKIMRQEKITIDPDLPDKEKDKIQNAWNKFILQTGNKRNQDNMLKTVRAHVSVDHGEFDREDMLLNTRSGYVDLSSGELHDHDIKKMFSRITSAEYSETIDAPKWLEFLNQIFNRDQEMIHFFQKVCGYCVTGSTKEQVMFICYGNGRNGKSVAINTVQDIIGLYSSTLDMDTLMASNGAKAGASPEIARLEGSRLVVTSESNDGSRFNESLIKTMTGGDRIVARFLYGEDFEFKPKFKLMMATNHLPVIRGTDDGIWRRLILIPFTVQIPEDKVDKNLPDKLKAESMGILNWIVQGAIAWQREGLEIPDSIKDASKEYRNEMDQIQAFVDDCCDVGKNYQVKASELFRNYDDWAAETNNYKYNVTRFGAKIANKFEKVRKRDGNYYIGLKIHENYPGLNNLV